MLAKKKGYRAERKTRMMFQEAGWHVIRAGGSLGPADLICIKDKKCILLQIKATSKKTLYYYENSPETFQGFPFYLVVDFGYGKVRILPPQKRVTTTDGREIKEFLTRS